MINVQFKLTIYLVLILTDIYSAVHVYLWWFPDKFPSVIESDPPVPARPCSRLPLPALVAPGAPVWRNFCIRKEGADRRPLADGLGFFLLYWVKWLHLVTSKRDFWGFFSPHCRHSGGGVAGGCNVWALVSCSWRCFCPSIISANICLLRWLLPL